MTSHLALDAAARGATQSGAEKPENLATPRVEVLLFDSDPIRRHVWERLCERRSFQLQVSGFVTERHFGSVSDTRVVIFDQSTLELCDLDPRTIIEKFPQDTIAFTCKNCQIATAAKLVRLGAAWVFDNAFQGNDIDEGFCELVRHAVELSAAVKSFQHAEAIRAKITAGEKDVLELVISGIPNKLIAKKLDISTRTVETRRSKVYRKCQVTNVTELVRFIDRANSLRARFQR